MKIINKIGSNFALRLHSGSNPEQVERVRQAQDHGERVPFDYAQDTRPEFIEGREKRVEP